MPRSVIAARALKSCRRSAQRRENFRASSRNAPPVFPLRRGRGCVGIRRVAVAVTNFHAALNLPAVPRAPVPRAVPPVARVLSFSLATSPAPTIMVVIVAVFVEPPPGVAVVTVLLVVALDLVEQLLQARILLGLFAGCCFLHLPFLGCALHSFG